MRSQENRLKNIWLDDANLFVAKSALLPRSSHHDCHQPDWLNPQIQSLACSLLISHLVLSMLFTVIQNICIGSFLYCVRSSSSSFYYAMLAAVHTQQIYVSAVYYTARGRDWGVL